MLLKDGIVQERIDFPGGAHFSFSLQIDSTLQNLEAKMDGFDIAICLPSKMATKWIETNEVGIEEHQAIQGDEKLHVLIEKDFSCGHRDLEELHDFFPELNNKDNC
ncbi:MAG: hypothetical protein AB8F95_19345 [Bacteroidia bacterium]